MKPVDLSIAPPRNPHAELAGVVFLPRTIDKVCASFPGGNLGLYTVEGFSTMLLDGLGIRLDAFVTVVREGADEDAVADFVRRETTPERIAAWNALIRERLPRGGDRAQALVVYPWLADYPELPKALDVLAEDDRRLFATSRSSG